MTTNIHEKIQALCKRSDQQLKTSRTNAKNGDFGSATSLLVTAFEERTKAVVLQIVELGFPIINNFSEIEYIFHQHDARHYIGYFVDCLYEIIEDFKIVLDRCRDDKNYVFKVARFGKDEETQKELIQWGLKKVHSFLEKIDFYKNIEKTRQKGLYVDVLNHRFSEDLNKEDYLFVKARLNTIHLLSRDLVEMKWFDDSDLMPSLQDSREKMAQTNIPGHLIIAIEIVKKERSKAFKFIKNQLLQIQEQLIRTENNLPTP